MKKYFYIFLILLLCGCRREEPMTFDDLFPQELPLVSELIPIAADDIDDPVYILCAEDYILCSNHNTQKAITVYDKKTGERLNDLVENGRASNEILGVSSIWNDDTHLNVYSGNSLKILRIPLSDLALAQPETSVKTLSFAYRNLTPISVAGGENYVAFNHSVAIAAENCRAEDQFILLDANSNPIYSFDSHPEIPGEDYSREISFVFQGELAAGADGRSVVYASNFGTVLKFFAIAEDEKVYKSMEYIIELPKYRSESDHSRNMYSVRWADDCRRGIRSIVSGPESYFLLLDPTRTVADKEWMVSTVYEFDFAGNPLRKYRLDKNVATVAYDRRAAALIAFTEEDGDYMFVSYSLPR